MVDLESIKGRSKEANMIKIYYTEFSVNSQKCFYILKREIKH